MIIQFAMNYGKFLLFPVNKLVKFSLPFLELKYILG